MLNLSKVTFFSFLFIGASSLSTFATEVQKIDSDVVGAKNTPQTVEEVLRDCKARIKMVENKEYLFKAPPKPSSPLKWSKWKKDVALLEKKKKDYIMHSTFINNIYKKDEAKLKSLSPTNPEYSSTILEVYERCKDLTDNLASKAAKAGGIVLPPLPDEAG